MKVSFLLCLLIIMLPFSILAQPEPLTELGSVMTPGRSAGVRLDDKIALIVEYQEGRLRIVDVADKENPFTISTLDLPGAPNDLDIDRVNDIAYIGAGYAGIHIVDYSTLSAPELVATIDTDGHSDGIEVDLAAGLLFNADRESSFDIYQIVDSTLILLFTDSWGFRCRDVEVRNGLVYVVWDFEGLQIYDYTNPAFPELLSTFSLPDLAYDIVVNEQNIAYIAGWYEGFHILDLNDPTEPAVLASVAVPGNVRGIRLHQARTHIGLISETTGLYIYDVSNPSTPVQTGGIDTPYQGKSLDIGAEYAYVTDGERFTIYELGDSITPPDISLVDGYVYDSTTDLGLEGAEVYITHVAALTNMVGYYSIESMVAGEYWVRVSKLGYQTYFNNSIVIEPGSNQFDFTLWPNILLGAIFDTCTGEELPGATVTLSGPGGTYVGATDQNGQYLLKPIVPGVYTLTASCTGYEGETIAEYSFVGPTQERSFSLNPSYQVSIQVEAENAPAIVPWWGGEVEFVVSLCTTPNFSPGTYTVWNEIVVPPGNTLTTLNVPVNLGPNMSTAVPMSLQVPAIAWSGVYTYWVKLGEDDFELASDSFQFGKMPQNPEGDEDTPEEPVVFGVIGVDGLKAFGKQEVEEQGIIPEELTLTAAPNPFNESTTLSLILPHADRVDVAVYDLHGRLVQTLATGLVVEQSATFSITADHWASGVYFVAVRSGFGKSQVAKLILLR